MNFTLMPDKDVSSTGVIYNKVKHSRDNQISSLQLRMKPICKASALGTGHYLSPVVGEGFGAKQGEI